MIPRCRLPWPEMSDLCSRAVDAVLFGALAGVLFGAFTVAVRYGLSRGVPVELGAAVTRDHGPSSSSPPSRWSRAPSPIPSTAATSSCSRPSARSCPASRRSRSIRRCALAGAARTAVLIGVAPLLSFVLAAVVPRARASAPASIAGRRADRRRRRVALVRALRPEGFRALGALLAVPCAGLFAIRDTLIRWGVGRCHARSPTAHRGLPRGGRPRPRGVVVAHPKGPPASEAARCASGRSCLRASVSAPPTSA